MMGFIKVTPEVLSDQATQISGAAEDVRELLSRLLAQVHELASQWEGAGATAFQDLYSEWQQGAAMTNEGMVGIAQFLTSAADQYSETDRAIANAGNGS